MATYEPLAKIPAPLTTLVVRCATSSHSAFIGTCLDDDHKNFSRCRCRIALTSLVEVPRTDWCTAAVWRWYARSDALPMRLLLPLLGRGRDEANVACKPFVR